jgi:hypothetical protein
MLLILKYQNQQGGRRHTSECIKSTRDELNPSSLNLSWEDKCHNRREYQCINLWRLVYHSNYVGEVVFGYLWYVLLQLSIGRIMRRTVGA